MEYITAENIAGVFANIFSLVAAFYFVRKNDKGPWYGSIAETFWLSWIYLGNHWLALPIDFCGFVWYVYACYSQLREKRLGRVSKMV